MYAKAISSVLLLLAVTNSAVAIVCGNPPLSACPTFPPCPPCTSNEFCCFTLGSRCVTNGGFCPRIGAAEPEK
ncbi:hypothetical protein FB45DRAFT_926926 [Roridomyces roridus]|uniref:Granulins domain-containing protein n=1 Tax=Roridomyces roridus TaxID=1738132 RepID=A0AAD7BIA6_9AGAR|nr:hypothetical protein FB45DRAFT_926926 [Roridomyces roridus]